MQLAAVYRLSAGAIELSRSTDDNNSSAKRPQQLQQQQRSNDTNSTNRTVNINGLLETDIDEVMAPAVDAEQRQTLVPPVDSGNA
jgi:hypothetical protein